MAEEPPILPVILTAGEDVNKGTTVMQGVASSFVAWCLCAISFLLNVGARDPLPIADDL